jgi:hypothetical protein
MDNILSAGIGGESITEIPSLTQAEFDEVVIRLGYHFGNTYLCRNIAVKRQDKVSIDLDIFNQAKTYKEELDNQVDSALSTLKEGTIESRLS